MNASAAKHDALIPALRAAGLVRSDRPILEPLTGGVSSEIILVSEGGRRFVVKRALAKLRVRDDWFADTSRSRSELAYLKRAEEIAPGCTPRILYSPPSGEWFAMEYLGAEFANWKARLLEGRAEPAPARQAGRLLGSIHRATWADSEAARTFATLENFRQLRLEPYLATAARRVPDLAPQLLAVERALANTALALVHGDFSPKNILISADRLVILDAEVAWFGDPAFDTAFLISHFLLKGLCHPANPGPFLDLTTEFWPAYAQAVGQPRGEELEARTAKIVLCLMLARVHGKSPVEYLNASQQTKVTSFVRLHLPNAPVRVSELTGAWRQSLHS